MLIFKKIDILLLFQSFLLVVVFTGLIISAFFTPPFEKPDEKLHFLRAFSLSKGTIICATHDEKTINMIPKKVYQYVYQLPNDFTDAPQVNEIKSCVLPFLFYIFSGMGILFSNIINLNTISLFYVGRFFNVIASFLLILWSIKVLPRKLRFISLYTFALPMSIYMISSYSKDALHIVLGLFVFNYFLSFWLLPKIEKKHFIIFCLFLFLFILSRPQYVFFIGLLFALPTQNLPKISLFTKKQVKFVKVYIFITLGFFLFSSLWFLIDHKIYLSPDNKNTALVFADLINPELQIDHILRNPFLFFRSIFNSLSHFGVFYTKSLIGIFGSLDEPLPNFTYFVYIISGLFMPFFIAKNKKLQKISNRKLPMLIIFTVVVLTVISIFLAMFLYSSPVKSPLILGVQGRYFIALVPWVILFVSFVVRDIYHHLENRLPLV